MRPGCTSIWEMIEWPCVSGVCYVFWDSCAYVRTCHSNLITWIDSPLRDHFTQAFTSHVYRIALLYINGLFFCCYKANALGGTVKCLPDNAIYFDLLKCLFCETANLEPLYDSGDGDWNFLQLQLLSLSTINNRNFISMLKYNRTIYNSTTTIKLTTSEKWTGKTRTILTPPIISQCPEHVQFNILTYVTPDIYWNWFS